jgi:hypothetical protein
MTIPKVATTEDAANHVMSPDGARAAADMVRDVLARCYPDVLLGEYRAVGDTYSFDTAAALRDAVTATARSGHPAVNDLAVARRLCQAFVRGGLGLEADTGLSIRSILFRQHQAKPCSGASYTLTLDDARFVRTRLDELRVTLARHSAALECTTTLTFGILGGSAIRFIRKSRDFSNYDTVAMERQDSRIEVVGPGRFLYLASEADRCIDGSRMDHVPAIVLSDLIYALIDKGGDPVSQDAAWTFPFYTDPRSGFMVETDTEARSVKVEQGGRVTATFDVSR